MNRKLFDKALDFEINVIGYKDKGESIVFFLKTDGKVAYAGLVDCYEEQSENAALMLMEEEHVENFDFVCWTHPHADHTIGMDNVLNNYCNEKTLFWIPPFISKDVEEYSASAQETYAVIFQILQSRNRNKMRVREASDLKTLDKGECCGNSSLNPYNFEIKCFAPDTTLLGELKVNERFKMGNIYSIGLIINVGHFYIILAGDVENRTFRCIPDFNLDITESVDYVKIPHHASSTASLLIDRLNRKGIAAPAVATTTVYRINDLPDKEIIKKYIAWGKDIEVYSTGNIESAERDQEGHGIIKTTIDVLANKEIAIITKLLGNAVCVNETV